MSIAILGLAVDPVVAAIPVNDENSGKLLFAKNLVGDMRRPGFSKLKDRGFWRAKYPGIPAFAVRSPACFIRVLHGSLAVLLDQRWHCLCAFLAQAMKGLDKSPFRHLGTKNL